MTPLARSMAALRWEQPDRVPVVPQNSTMAVALAGYDMIECSHDGRKLALAMLACREKFGYDGHFMGPDAAILAEALGCPVEYRPDNPPALTGHVLERLEDVDKLKPLDPSKDGRLPQWLKAVETLVAKEGDRVLVIGRADQCGFTLAALLRGMEQFLLDISLGEKPELVHKLIAFCNQCHIELARAMKRAGAHVTTCGDAFGGPDIVGPPIFNEYVLPYEKEATRAIQEEIGLPYSIHICGRTDAIHDQWVETGAAAFEIDHRTDIKRLRSISLGKTALIGNLDTEMLARGTPAEVENACRDLFQVMLPQSGFILSSGCSMLSSTKPENLAAMVAAARRYGVYPRA
ncbi:uroporphyrinogen decarboxylase family protein [Moorella naiadis]|uniref:uroporphyrinogen decarboxylase family protein n=1 Tax=Moorella naiadis (nom. illeg.) TaxID=3093670 RepID=UPI003D9CA237